MLIPSVLHHSASCVTHDPFVPDEFGVLCWNVHKNNFKHAGFKPFVQRFVKEKSVDFVLFQEAGFQDKKPFFLHEFGFDAVANLEHKRLFWGVLTASRCKADRALPFLSKDKELFIATHKSMLISHYTFKDESVLWILNLHAINFRGSRSYQRELDRISECIREYQGALIVAGDFNSWNRQRMKQLEKMAEALILQSVSFETKAKSVMGNTLDFIFYRGLELTDTDIVHDHGLSDHHPLYAMFRRKQNKLTQGAP